MKMTKTIVALALLFGCSATTNAQIGGLLNKAKKAAKENGIDLKEGVYCQFTGPAFESPAEIRMAARIGADVAGMSTAVEATAANHMGMKICGISFISNPAAGISPVPLTHEEVQEAAAIAAPKFKKLISDSVKNFDIKKGKR